MYCPNQSFHINFALQMLWPKSVTICPSAKLAVAYLTNSFRSVD